MFKAIRGFIGSWEMERQYKSFLNKKIDNGFDFCKTNAKLAYITVAFNDEKYVIYQERLLRKFSLTSYHYWIVDNSTCSDASERIKNVAANKSNVYYVRVPPIPKDVSYSNSHAYALNWFLEQVIKNNPSTYEIVVFLDHDIFPISSIDIYSKVDGLGLYGRRMECNVGGEKYWYFWPGLYGVKINKYLQFLDFRTSKWGDTGSRMYDNLYKDINGKSLEFAQGRVIELLKEPKDNSNITTIKYGLQKYYVEEYDSQWLHMINGSNWANIEMDKKRTLLFEKLDDILKTS